MRRGAMHDPHASNPTHSHGSIRTTLTHSLCDVRISLDLPARPQRSQFQQGFRLPP
jgi:hypothetical protein